MKELSVEEKARRYDEALERAIAWRKKYVNFTISEDGTMVQDFDNIFPELKESEDERIRKALIKFHKSTIDVDGIKGEDVIAWLEKQGEQKANNKIQMSKKYKCIASPRYSTFFRGEIYKPEDEFLCSLMNFCSDCFEPIEDGEQKSAEWSEEDEENLNWFEKFFRAESVITEGKDIPQNRYLWFKNLKGRVQPKKEWSEKDEKMIRALISMCDVWATSNQFYPKENKEMEAVKTWLKLLKERYTWKPSNEQMDALEKECIAHSNYELCRLLDQLKELREE